MIAKTSVPSSAAEARDRADRIRAGLEDLKPLIVAAWEARDWEALGYDSWQAYVVGEYGGPLRLGRPERQQAVAEMRAEGMSTRAIGSALGVDHRTVGHDLEGGEYSPPAPVTGLDGRTYTIRPLDIHFSSDSPEWYTPPHIVAAVVETLATIDLDPCSNLGTPNVPARRHFTADDDGLAQPWVGRVYMNPPYGREIGAWVEKLAHEYEAGRVTEAIALVPARVDTAWWRRLPHVARPRREPTATAPKANGHADARATWDADDAPVARPRDADKRRRLIDAIDEMRLAARAFGIDTDAVGQFYAPWPMRVDAWLYRVERDRRAWQRLLRSPLFTAAEQVAA